MGEQMLDAPTLWDLIETRAAATPDAVMAVDESGREMTFAEYRDQVERAAAGLAAEHGIGAGDVITWQLPTWLESMVLVGAISRLGATQNPILPIYREREVGFCVRQTGAKLLVVPTDFARLRLRGHGREDRRRRASTGCGVAAVATARCPRATRDAARRRPTVGRRRALALLHVGHHRRSRRAPGTPTARSTPWPRAWASGSRITAADRNALGLPVHPHRRHHLAVHQPADAACATSSSRPSSPTWSSRS